MTEIAGSVIVDIGGNLTPLEGAFAKGEQMSLAFNAKMTAILSGSGLTAGLEKIAAGVEQTNALLGKLTTSGTTAGATMTRLVTATQPVTAALQQVTAASVATNAELGKIGTTATSAGFSAGAISAKEFAAALEQTGGNLAKITPAMLGIAETESAMTAATLEATAAFRGLTEAQIAAFASQQEGTNFRNALNESFGLINNTTKSAKDSALAFRDLAIAEGEAGGAARGAAAGMTALGVAETEAAGLGAQVTREFTVLGAEVARGNFSRIPGSLLVLNERLVSTGTGVLTLGNFMKAFGGLAEVIFNPYVIGFLGLTIGLDLAVKGFEKLGLGTSDLTKNLKDQKEELADLGKTYGDVAKQAEAFSVGGLNSFGISASATLHGLQLDLKGVTKDLEATLGYLGGFDSTNTFQIYDDFKPFTEAINHLRETAAAGAPDILGFKKMVEDKWALTPNDEALTKTAAELEGLVKPALSASVALQQLKIAQDQLGGRGNEGANMIANMVSAGNAAADALKKVQDSLSITGQTPYAASIANINRQFDDMIVKAHASGAALATFNQARGLSIQEASLKALGEITFDTPIVGADKLGIALTTAGLAADHVKVSIGGISAPVVNMTRLLGAAKLDQLLGVEDAANKLEEYKISLVHVQSALDVLHNMSGQFFGDAFKGSQTDISGAYTAIDDVFKLFDHNRASVKDVHDRIEEVRASLIALGGDEASVKQYITDIVNAEAKTRQLNSDVQTLGGSINHLPNKTVTITVVTQQVGSGTKSIYDVGTTGGIGVTRYGAASGSQSGPSMTAYQVPTYDSGMGGMVNTGSGSGGGSGVTVTRYGGARAAGGPVGANTPYWVGEHGPELVVPSSAGSVIPNSQSTALANPQSGFTGTQATKENDRYWVVLMNIEAATQKTAQLLDEIKTAGASFASNSSSSSSGSSSSTGNAATDPLAKQYAAVLTQIEANFHAAGIVGAGQIGYGSNGLAATPQQIAHNIVYGGPTSVGAPSGGGSSGGGGYQTLPGGQQYPELAGLTPNSPGYAAAYNSALARLNKSIGFSTGGIDSSDTQKVEFFKSPGEKVIIARPDQFADVRPGTTGTGSAGGTDGRPISISIPITIQSGANVSKDSIAAMRTQLAAAVRDGLRAVNGR